MLRPQVCIGGFVPLIQRMPISAFTSPAKRNRGNSERHRKIGIRARSDKGEARRARDGINGAPCGLHNQKVRRHESCRPVPNELYLDIDLIGPPTLVFVAHSFLHQVEDPRFELQKFLG